MRKRGVDEPGLLQRAVQAVTGAGHSIRAMLVGRPVQRARARAGALLTSLTLSGLMAAATVSTPAVAAHHGPTVTAALASLKSSGAITEAAYARYTSAYAAAQSSLKKLSGTRRAELQSVIGNTQQMAAANELTPSRLPVVMLTLEKNRQWWSTEPLIASRERVSFPPSKIVWEYYAGQGVQIQWLGTFGEANGYYLSGHENESLRQLLSEVIPLATDRAGGIAWEYMFKFDGGAPPWTSGLSQGTALQVLARAWSRFKEPAYLTAAQQALGIFETPPPQGVQVKTPAGSEYAEYTYAPSDRILNGFIQADVGLYDYTSITKDPLGLKLFEEGDAEARAETPHYDTGAWSMYDQYGESDLNYHELLTEFLQHLCERTRKGAPTATAVTPAPSHPRPRPRRGRAGQRTRRRGRHGTGGASAASRDPRERRRGAARNDSSRRPKARRSRSQAMKSTARPPRNSPPTCTRRRSSRCSAPRCRRALAGGRAGVAVEDLRRARNNPPRGQDGVEQRRDRGTRQAEAAVGHAGADGRLLGHGHGD